MRKRITIIMTIILLMICTKNVNAEEAWPKSFSYNSYTYTVENVSLYVYEYNNDSQEDSIKYKNESPTTTIGLGAGDYTISPEAKDGSIQGISAIIIDLNLNVSADSLRQLLSEQIASVTQNEAKSYMVDLVVGYKITAYPDNLQYAYKANTLRSSSDSVMSVISTNGINLEETNTQVLNTIVIDRDSASGEAYLFYEDEYRSDNGVGLFALNYTLLTEEEYTSISSTPAETSQIVMFHNLNNIDEVIANASNIKQSDISDVIPNQVRVPSTAWNHSSPKILLGILFMLFGTVTISKVLLNNN